MAKIVKRRTTTTVTEEMELVPTEAGEEIEHRLMTVHGYGNYIDDDGYSVSKPQIIMNAKWLADAGFEPGSKIDIEVRENQLVVRKLVEG